jgi:hypothetical protein
VDASYALLFSDYERLGASMGLTTVSETLEGIFKPQTATPARVPNVQPVVTKSQNDQALAQLQGMMKRVKK